jgi:hypothetical protein
MARFPANRGKAMFRGRVAPAGSCQDEDEASYRLWGGNMRDLCKAMFRVFFINNINRLTHRKPIVFGSFTWLNLSHGRQTS